MTKMRELSDKELTLVAGGDATYTISPDEVEYGRRVDDARAHEAGNWFG